MDGLSRVWALGEDGSDPEYFVHISREGGPRRLRFVRRPRSS